MPACHAEKKRNLAGCIEICFAAFRSNWREEKETEEIIGARLEGTYEGGPEAKRERGSEPSSRRSGGKRLAGP